MAVVARYLLDTSAAARMRFGPVAERLSPLIEAGLVATCAALDYEALVQSRSPADYEDRRTDRRYAYEYLPTGDEEWQRALGVHRNLARQSMWRAVGLPDLLIAAVAERHEVAVVHYDADFDLIASITAQAVEWVVRAGTVP